MALTMRMRFTVTTHHNYFIFGKKIFMEYTLIKKTDANELITEENAWIQKGWKPTGGVSIAFGRIRNNDSSKAWLEVLFHIQAMIKE